MFAEFVVTYVPIAIAVVVLVPVLLALAAMFIDSVRTKQWSSRTAPERREIAPAVARHPSRRDPVRTELPLTGGMGLRHGMAARHEHD